LATLFVRQQPEENEDNDEPTPTRMNNDDNTVPMNHVRSNSSDTRWNAYQNRGGGNKDISRSTVVGHFERVYHPFNLKYFCDLETSCLISGNEQTPLSCFMVTCVWQLFKRQRGHTFVYDEATSFWWIGGYSVAIVMAVPGCSFQPMGFLPIPELNSIFFCYIEHVLCQL
jgi:hypothetical protein